MFRIGLLLGFAAVFLQIAVFLQPLLPKQYQIAPVCETITRALFQQPSSHFSTHAHSSTSSVVEHSEHLQQIDADAGQLAQSHHAHLQHTDSQHQHHDLNHQCQYCTVMGNLILPPELNLKPILDRIQVRLIAFQKAFKHVYFVLHRLFLLPQGRAPPLFA